MNSFSSSSLLTLCQGGRNWRAVSPGFCTAFSASCCKVPGLEGSRGSRKFSCGSGFNGENERAIVDKFRRISTASENNLLKEQPYAKWRFVLATLLYIKHTFTRSLVPFVFPWVLHRSDLFALFHVLLPHPYPFHIAHVPYCFTPFRNLTLSTFSS